MIAWFLASTSAPISVALAPFRRHTILLSQHWPRLRQPPFCLWRPNSRPLCSQHRSRRRGLELRDRTRRDFGRPISRHPRQPAPGPSSSRTVQPLSRRPSRQAAQSIVCANRADSASRAGAGANIGAPSTPASTGAEVFSTPPFPAPGGRARPPPASPRRSIPCSRRATW